MSDAPAPREASSTALGVAAFRAAHQLVDGEPKILDDPVSARLLEPAAVAAIEADPERLRTPRALALRSHLLARSRCAEDALASAAARGVRQCVMLGAGLDTFAWRQPAWAEAVRIFEVDHPASQAAKRDRLRRAGLADPPNLAFVPCDLERDDLASTLAAAGFDASRPAFVSMLGVLVYLDADTADAVFRRVASLPRGSELVFTFSPPEPWPNPDGLAARAAAVGEPWRTRLGPDELAPMLRSLGFSRIDFPDVAPYFAGRADGLPAPREPRICHAVV